MAGRNYVTPEERVEPFIGYLRNEIRTQRTNAPQYAIHMTREGVFLRSPDIFQDFNASHYAQLQQDLSATIYVKMNPQNQPFWKCFNTSDGVWYGYLLDPRLLGIHEKVAGHIPKSEYWLCRARESSLVAILDHGGTSVKLLVSE